MRFVQFASVNINVGSKDGNYIVVVVPRWCDKSEDQKSSIRIRKLPSGVNGKKDLGDNHCF